MRAGASRKSIALRVGGVSIDDQVVLAARVDLEQPLHRDVVVALHEARGEVVYSRFSRMRYAVSSSWRVRSTRSSHDCFVSSIAAQSSPRGSMPALLQHLGRNLVCVVADALEPERGREPPGGVDREHEHLAAEAGRRRRARPRRRPTSCRRRPNRRRRRSPSSRGAARASPVRRRRGGAAGPPSQPELRAERVGDHPRDAQAVRAHEEVRHVQQREIDRARAAPRGAPPVCGAATPRAGPRRAPRSRRGRARRSRQLSRAGARNASNVSSSACVNSSGSTRLTITAPSGTSTSARKRCRRARSSPRPASPRASSRCSPR